MKYGWIVYEELSGAESCENGSNKLNINGSRLKAMILPASITNESTLKEIATIIVEGIPTHLCNEAQAKKILQVILPRWLMASFKFLQVRFKSSYTDTSSYTNIEAYSEP